MQFVRDVDAESIRDAYADGIRKNLGDDNQVEAFFAKIGQTLSTKHDAKIVQPGCIAPLKSAVLAVKLKQTKKQ